MNVSPQIDAISILESIADAFFSVDCDYKITYVNKRFEEIFEVKRENILLKNVWKAVPMLRKSKLYQHFCNDSHETLPLEFLEYFKPTLKWLNTRTLLRKDGYSAYFTDVTDAMKKAEAQRFFIEASEILSSSLDYETTLANVARLAVPVIADWCSVHILMDDGTLRQLAIAHIDPAKIKLARKFEKKYPNQPSGKQGIYNVARTGCPELLETITDEMLEASSQDPEYLTILRALGLRSYMILPLIARNKVLGTMTFVGAESGLHFTKADVASTEAFAGRAALAVDNARLYKAAQHNKECLELAQKAAKIASFDWNLDTKKATWTNEMEALYDLEPGKFNGSFETWLSRIHPDDTKMVANAISQSVLKKTDLECEFRVPHSDGSCRWISVKAHAHRNTEDKSWHMAGVNMDITERKRSEEAIRYQAFHDALTGLPNRLLLNDRMEVALAHAKIKREKLAVLFLDLDRFKDVNDTLGHTIGDKLLQEVAKRLTSSLGELNTVARFGGDEFLIVIPGIQDTEEALGHVQTIFKELKPSIAVHNREIYLNTSMGIAIYPTDGETVDTLLKNADAALYQAKEAGRNKYQLYSHTMHLLASERLSLENDLRKALERNEFRLYYQPILDLKDASSMRAEALIRWQHPDRGLLTPDVFIPLAEETGLILPIGEWVLKTACKQISEWKRDNIRTVQIAINLSTRQFVQDDLPELIKSTLEEYRVAPSLLQLEITESVAMNDMNLSITQLKKLRELGVFMVIDDFGTGHSSLSYLKRLPLDRLKIDKSFIKHCATDSRDAAIIKAIITMAHTLKLRVCGEGVENSSQLKLLAEGNCDSAQGFLISRPLPVAQFTELLKQGNNAILIHA
jgi:diguanylate cyclase (GGDEF)-like protein/PAS domain S-box-containing protein